MATKKVKKRPEISHEDALLLLEHRWRPSDRAPLSRKVRPLVVVPLDDFLNMPLDLSNLHWFFLFGMWRNGL